MTHNGVLSNYDLHTLSARDAWKYEVCPYLRYHYRDYSLSKRLPRKISIRYLSWRTWSYSQVSSSGFSYPSTPSWWKIFFCIYVFCYLTWRSFELDICYLADEVFQSIFTLVFCRNDVSYRVCRVYPF